MAEEYISRNDLLRKISSFNWCMMVHHPDLYENVVEMIVQSFAKQVEQAVVKNVAPVEISKWLFDAFDDRGIPARARCSLCRRVSFKPLGRFCRWCGARIIENEETE